MPTSSRLAARAAALACLVALLGLPAFADEEAITAFKRAWAAAQDVEQQKAALAHLAGGRTPACGKLLVKLSLDEAVDYRARDAAEAALGTLAQPEVVAWAAAAVRGEERDAAARVVLCRYLGTRATGDPDLGLHLLPALEDRDVVVRCAAVQALGGVRRVAVVGALVRVLPGWDGRAAGDCVRALQRLTGERHASAVEWTSWWEATRERFTFDGPPPRDPEPDRFRTVTRLEPPGPEGNTVYEQIDSHAVLFVLDFSGSMQVPVAASDGRTRTRMEYVQEALAGAISEQLEEEDRFNVIAFSDSVAPWKRRLVQATSANRRDAVRFVRALRPEGQTNISDSLELAFSHPDVDTIYFLSDGTPTRGRLLENEAILGEVRRWNAGRGVRLCTIAFLTGDGAGLGVVEDKGMSERFLRALAEQNQGTFRVFQ